MTRSHFNGVMAASAVLDAQRELHTPIDKLNAREIERCVQIAHERKALFGTSTTRDPVAAPAVSGQPCRSSTR